jgi:hypothetical protein
MSAPNLVFLALSRELKNHQKATKLLASVLRTAPLPKVVYPTSNYEAVKKIIELPFSTNPRVSEKGMIISNLASQ